MLLNRRQRMAGNLSGPDFTLLQRTLQDRTYGARPLRRAIQRHIEDALSEAFIRGQIRPNLPILVDVEGGQLWYRQDGRGGVLSA